MKLRDALWGAAVLVVAAVGFGAGVYADQAFPDYLPYVAHHSAGRIDTTELEEAMRLIEADYVDGNIDTKKLSQGTVQGLVASLGDPFSAYYSPEQYKHLLESYAGRISGIGVYLRFGTGYPVITATIPGSPAVRAGLQTGDQIVKVGEQDMSGATPDQATTAIDGPTGTTVTLTIGRGSQTFTAHLTRAEIQVPSVQSTVIGNDILYARIYTFGSSTANEFSTVLKAGLAGARAMVLDLRDDPGGFITAADNVISEFITSGETFELRDRNGNVERHQVSGEHLAATIPLVVLVDANSASAAEIVAGSLQVHHRAKLVGMVTFGKGSVQQDFELSDGADIHLTIKRWYLPNGQTIDKKGLQPDVTVALPNVADQFDVLQPADEFAKDAQLKAGLSVLAAGH
jgi:carboxyl-terminal processing protease